MKVVISTAGRFHLFALARELERRGALERIYSGFIWRALAREDLPRSRVTTFPWFRTPYMALGRSPVSPPRALGQWLEWMSCAAQDAYVARRLPDCDVFVGHDGAGLAAGREAKRRGGLYVMDTGTMHVAARDAMLREEFAGYGEEYRNGNRKIHERLLEEYETADAIFVPSTFVKRTFIERGVSADKIYKAPYGVRETHFRQVVRPPEDSFRVLFVGALSIRKGARYLLEAFRRFAHREKELTIIGAVSDEVRPLLTAFGDLNIKCLGPLPNAELPRFYSASHVFVLPSLEEGLALVMAEALACGCPVIASRNTGAEDLFSHGREGFIVPIRDAPAISRLLEKLADEPDLREEMSNAALERIKTIGGWSAYGQSYFEVLGQLSGHRRLADAQPLLSADTFS